MCKVSCGAKKRRTERSNKRKLFRLKVPQHYKLFEIQCNI